MQPPASPPRLEDLLRQTPWLRRLAGELCADPGTVDDLVQDACVAAVEHPPRSAGALRGWLVRVLRNLHHQRHRGERARQVREHARARREAIPAAADVVARAETGRRLVACVLELAEPYRGTVLLRYFDELSAEEIGRQHGVPGSTVRTRLARGLALLRERLRREGGEAWFASAAWLAHSPAASASAAAAPALGATSGLMGAIVMSTVTKLCVAGALAAAVLWALWPNIEPPAVPLVRTAAGSEPATRTPDTESAGARRAPLAPAGELAASTPSVAGPAPEPSAEPSIPELEALMTEVAPGTLEGIVLRGRARVAGASVRCWQSWSPLPAVPRPGVLATTTNELGEFRFQGLSTERYRVGVDGPGGAHAETMVQVLAEQPSRRVVLLLGSGRIEGRVYDAEGQPAAGAWVAASLDTMRLKTRMGFETGRRTDARGAFVLDALPAGSYWLWARLDGDCAAGVQPDSMQQLPALRVGETRVVELGAPRRAAVWTGTVRTRSGEPVAGPATIALTEAVSGVYQEAQYDALGQFRIPLRPGTWKVGLVTRANWNQRVALEPVAIAAADLARDLTLPGTRLAGTLVDQGTGQRWARARPTVQVSIHREGHDYPAAFQHLDVTGDGGFVFDGLEPGTWLLSTRFIGFGNNSRHEVPGANVNGFRFHVLASDLEVPVRVPLTPP